MSLTIRLTTDMNAEEMLPLWPGIIACLEKYCARFAHEETVENILTQCAQGMRQLWILQDEEGHVVLAPITEIRTVDATGKKRLTLAECGGERLPECLTLLHVIEDWAKENHGIEAVEMLGRKGWARLLPKYGYKEVSILFRKEVA